jgi:hypothetical protein
MKVKVQKTVAHITGSPKAFERPLRELRPTSAHFSWEGIGISVTYAREEYVEAWGQIAKIGREAVVLTHIDGTPGRFAISDSDLEKKAITWGIEHGWVKMSPAWRMNYVDEETGDKRYSDFDTEKAARDEAVYLVEDEGHEKVEVIEVSVPKATPKLQTRLRQHFPKGGDVPAEIEAVNIYVAAKKPQLDGVWWNDRFDPDALSAPRGVILPHALSRWVGVGKI